MLFSLHINMLVTTYHAFTVKLIHRVVFRVPQEAGTPHHQYIDRKKIQFLCIHRFMLLPLNLKISPVEMPSQSVLHFTHFQLNRIMHVQDMKFQKLVKILTVYSFFLLLFTKVWKLEVKLVVVAYFPHNRRGSTLLSYSKYFRCVWLWPWGAHCLWHYWLTWFFSTHHETSHYVTWNTLIL